MFDRHWHQKPPRGTPINPEHPLASRLVAFWPLWEGRGLPVELVSAQAAASNSTSWAGSSKGWALSGGNGAACVVNNTPLLNVTGPITIAALARPQVGISPQRLYSTGYSSSMFSVGTYGGVTQLTYANGNGSGSPGSYPAPDGGWHVFAVSQASPGSASFYMDAVPLGTASMSGYAVSYTGQRSLMADSNATNPLYGPMSWLAIWSRALTGPELLTLTSNPWELFAPGRMSAAIPMTIVPGFSISSPAAIYAGSPATTLTLRGYQTTWGGGTTFSVSEVSGASRTSQSVTNAGLATITVSTGPATGTLTVSDGSHTATIAVVAPTMSAAPFTIPAHHSGHITVALSGTGTSWATGTTTFSVSGVSGVSIVGQSIASPSSASLVLTTGSGTGTLTITDGTSSTPIPVVVAGLSASPNPVAASGKLSLAGAGTVWTQESAPGLFSIAGTAGAGLSGITVLSDTQATAALSASTASGAVTITDSSTGTTATVTADAVSTGSLRVGGQLMAGPSGSSTLFGNRSSATLAFRFKVNSGAGRNSTAGTWVISWGTNPQGGLPLAVYFPATGQLTITAYGGNSNGYYVHTFAASVPIQQGVGYHFLLSWGPTPQLYVNGLLYATAGFSNSATFPYQQVQVGGNAGAGIALDHDVSDLAIWNNYAASAADALSLASAAATPLQVGGTQPGTSCTAWWPLGGGTVGGTPSISDQWFADYTANGNTLSVLAGALSNTTYAAGVGLGSPAAISAFVSKCGKVAFFGATSSVPAANGGYPLAPITAVSGTPTVSRGGTPVQIGGATWFPAEADTPFVAYLLECGSVQAISVVTAGSNYTNPTVTASGGGGSGATFGTPVLKTGVTGYTVLSSGSFGGAPSVSVAPPTNVAGPQSGTPATARTTVSGGNLSAVLPGCGGVPGCGSGYSTSGALPTVTIGPGSGAQLVPVVSGNKITAINVLYGFSGTGYPSAAQVNIWDPTGTGATATATMVGTGGPGPNNYGVISVTVTSQGTGYTNPVVTLTPAGYTASVRPTISSYIALIPVTNGGSGYSSPPTISVSDPTGTGATFTPIMSGVSPGDVLTYSAPAAWITPSIGGQPLGGLQAVSGAHMDNWTGRLEGASGGFAAFTQTPTMLAGANVGEQPTNYSLLAFTAKNRLHQGGGWGASGSGSLSSSNGLPISWTSPGSTSIQNGLYGPGGPNYIDSSGWPNQIGQWTLEYDDSQANTATASAAWLYCQPQGGYSYTTVVPLNLSGPNAGTTTGAVVNSADVSYSYGGGLTAIGVTHSSLGSGYQGAMVVISGGGGSGAIATAVVSGGAIASFHIVCPGSGYSSTPTVTVYGTKISGTTVTAIFDIGYSSNNPTYWSLNVTAAVAAPANNTGLSDGKAYWTIGNPWIVAPNAATGLAVASIDRTQALATDDNALQALTTPGGKVPGVLRFMDVNQGYGGLSNFIYGADLMDPTQPSWQGEMTLNATFQFVRYWNTNPSSTTYSWSSTKVYGPQAYHCEADPPFSITATTTSGSATITGITAALMAGSAISGPGIPSGTIISRLGSGGTTALLSQAATASGTAVSLTVTNPGYIPMPANDNGYWANNHYGSQNWAVWEMRSTTPHGLSTGQLIDFNNNNNALPLTYFGSWNPNGGLQVIVIVTGPYTIAATGYVNGGAPGSNQAQTINSTTELNFTSTGGWAGTVTIPSVNHCVPYEYSAAMAGQLPGTALWVNIPHMFSDDLATTIARKVAANIGPSNPVYVEYGNENWNGFFPYYQWYWSLGTLLSYIPAGTTAMTYYTSTGAKPPYDAYGAATLLTAHAHDTFIAAWTAAGQDPSRVHRVFGSCWNQLYRTQDIVQAAGQWGFAVDHIAVAPYYDLPNDYQIVLAHATAGTSYSNAGNWPVDALNDLNRHWLTYCSSNQSYWAQHATYAQAYGQPVASVDFTDANATAAVYLSPTSISSVSVVNGGSGYTNPVVSFVGGGGRGATGTATVSNGVITGITVTNGGSGYNGTVGVSISDPNGSGFGAGVGLAPAPVGSVVVTSAGVGYLAPPQVTIQNQDGNGSGATATTTISGGRVTGITLTSGGSGYTTTPKITLSGGGGGLAAGQYYAGFTYVDSQGRETTMGLSRVGWIAINSGDIPTFAMPPWPPWAASMNMYLSPPYGVPGTEVFYMNIPRSQYQTTYAVGAPIPLSAAIPSPGTQKPPATNQAAANIPNLPSVVTYEGGIQQGVPAGTPYADQLFHDTFAHPSQRDLIWGWYASCQLGCQWQAGSGAALATYYQLYSNVNYPNGTWQLAYGPGQSPGDGISSAYLGSTTYTVPANQFAMIQGGLPADNHDHNMAVQPGQANTSPALQGLRDWINASSPLPVQPIPPSNGRTRRWFSGLSPQSALRLVR